MSKKRIYSVEYEVIEHVLQSTDWNLQIDDSGKNLRQVVGELFREHFSCAANSISKWGNMFVAHGKEGNELAIAQFNYGTPSNQAYINQLRAHGITFPDSKQETV